jgi:sugar phosphate isomerase/epimerase
LRKESEMSNTTSGSIIPMSIGMCLGHDQVAGLAPGYDYLEMTVSGALSPLEDDAAFAPKLAALQAMPGPPIRAFNVFLPGSLRVTGPEVDWPALSTYVGRAVDRAFALGGEIIVFGSGGARRIPDGFSRGKAWEQLVRFCSLCAQHLAGSGITLAIEPLNRNESNVINSYLEGVRLARDVNRPEVRVLADIYHFEMDGEPLEDIIHGADWLAHVHLADTGRLHPGSGEYPLARWFDILKFVGYQGMASVECRWGDDYAAQTAESLAFLRPLVS